MKYKMNDKIEILEARLVIDAKGFQKREYSTVLTLWANHKSLSYKHDNQASTLITKKVESFLVRNQKAFYDELVTDDMLVRYKERLYKIISIDDTYEDDNFIIIRCERYE